VATHPPDAPQLPDALPGAVTSPVEASQVAILAYDPVAGNDEGTQVGLKIRVSVVRFQCAWMHRCREGHGWLRATNVHGCTGVAKAMDG
jgi:hypothetical protein